MHPVLFEIPLFGGIPINGYGVMMALGFLLGSWYVKNEARRVGADGQKAMDLILVLLISGVFASRIIHVFVNEWDRFLGNPLVLFYVWEGGLVWYGGLIGATLTAFWFFRRHCLPVLQYLDLFVPAVALGHAIGRQGCFLAGCCYGKPLLAAAWYGVTFPAGVGSFAPTGVALYPTQLAESLLEFLIFLGLAWYRRCKRFEGELFFLYLMVYAVVRAALEGFRGDADRGFVIDPWLSTSQSISLLLFAMAAILYLRAWRKAR